MRILVAGDFVPRRRISESISRRDYSFFDELKDINRKVDYSLLNLESPIVINAKAKPIKKSGPNLRCTKGAIEAIKYAGFDCVTLANNHLYDFGHEGYLDTINTCNEFGIDYVGVGDNLEEAKKILYKNLGGKTIAIINFCENEWSIATKTTSGANPLNVVHNYYQIKDAKGKADYVMVIVHGGTEYYQLPTPRMRDTYRFFVDAGADVVINHHQHCYSGFELYNNKPIVYGLGNLCFDSSKPNPPSYWKEGYIAIFEFKDTITYSFIPYEQCGSVPIVHLNEDTSQFDKRMKELNSIINREDILNEHFVEKCNDSLKCYNLLIEPLYNNRILSFLFLRNLLPSIWKRKKIMGLLNLISCESHRDILIKVIKSKL